MIAIIVLLILGSYGSENPNDYVFLKALIALPILSVLAYACVKWVILPLLSKFDIFHEYIFLMAIGWCLGLAELANFMGLSKEMGAFIAGITLATHPVAQFMTDKLKPIRDFFLVLFFFTLGAGFELDVLAQVWPYALILSVAVIIIKPITFKFLLRRQSEKSSLSWDIGFRLGQTSEFSLLISYLALSTMIIGSEAAQTIQATAVITFILSTYIVIFKYPNPIAPSPKLRRD
ncbi:MAG: Kef-type K+ transport system membrane component KefB [Bermanella sp.]|jgi:Kef-type K+ transport system membrane component KefB